MTPDETPDEITDEITAASPLPVIEMVHAMPGFPEARQFALVQLDEDGTLCSLRAVDHDDLQFVVVPPTPFFPDYAPEIGDDVVEELGLETADDVVVLLVVHAGDTLADTTVNLRAPVLVNRHTLRASQVILEDADFEIAAPLVA